MKRTPQFTAWIDGLKDIAGRARILARIRRFADGNPGDHRNLTVGVSERASMSVRVTGCISPSVGTG